MSLAYRPSHADATYDFKYGVRSVQGGGRSSARVTIGRVAAGAIAKKILKLYSGTEILAYVSQVNKVVLPEGLIDNQTVTLEQIESNIIRCPNPEYAEEMVASIDAVRTRGDSVSGVVACIDIGTPVFDNLEAELAKACMSLPATKGFEIGSGFAGTFMTGSEHNDEFFMDQHDQIRTKTNRSGGVQGGISNGEIINMSIAFKPTSTISKLELEGSKDYAGIFLYVYFRMIRGSNIRLVGRNMRLNSLLVVAMILVWFHELFRWWKQWLPWCSWISWLNMHNVCCSQSILCYRNLCSHKKPGQLRFPFKRSGAAHNNFSLHDFSYFWHISSFEECIYVKRSFQRCLKSYIVLQR